MRKIPRIQRKNRTTADRQQPVSAESDAVNLWHDPFVHAILIIAIGFIVYFNVVTTPFLFDDYLYLVNNPLIRDFGFFRDTDRVLALGINTDLKYNFILRPVSYFTFALNYALHGLDVRGYHVANLLMHLGNALLLYLMLSLLFRSPGMSASEGDTAAPTATTARYLPLFCALLFVAHPLQTQAVTYIIQRFTPLATLLYLGSLVLYLQGRLGATAPVRNSCYLLSIVVAVLAMKTKENAFTLPVMIALVEWLFLSGSIGSRLVRLAPFLLTMAIIPLNLMELSALTKPGDTDAINDSINLVNFRGVSSWDYLMTQFGVITTYLRLMILPVGQNFDYDWQLQKHFFSLPVLAPLTILLSILAAGIYAWFRSRDRLLPGRDLHKIFAMGIFWMFIALSVESSIVPLDDLIFEHRFYLPSIGFFMALLGGVAIVVQHWAGIPLFASRIALSTLVVAIAVLSLAGIARNRVWGDDLTFWNDVVRKSPGKARVHTSLGVALLGRGENEAAVEEFRAAIRLKPKSLLARVNLGRVLTEQKRFDEAERELQTAVRLHPANPIPHVDLGLLHEAKGDMTKARWAYLAAIRIAPDFPETYLLIGELYAKGGELQNAIQAFERALQLYPDGKTATRLAELRRSQEHTVTQPASPLANPG